VYVGPGQNIQLFQPDTAIVYLGTSAAALEGFIPLCLPIQNSMAEPHLYPTYIKVGVTSLTSQTAHGSDLCARDWNVWCV
jgi:hypothetical protein